jgi:hypothetical protein
VGVRGLASSRTGEFKADSKSRRLATPFSTPNDGGGVMAASFPLHPNDSVAESSRTTNEISGCTRQKRRRTTQIEGSGAFDPDPDVIFDAPADAARTPSNLNNPRLRKSADPVTITPGPIKIFVACICPELLGKQNGLFEYLYLISRSKNALVELVIINRFGE